MRGPRGYCCGRLRGEAVFGIAAISWRAFYPDIYPDIYPDVYPDVYPDIYSDIYPDIYPDRVFFTATRPRKWTKTVCSVCLVRRRAIFLQKILFFCI